MATIDELIIWFHPEMHRKVLYLATKMDITISEFVLQALEAGIKQQCYGVDWLKLQQYTYGVRVDDLNLINVPVGREVIMALDEYLEGKSQCSRLALVRFLVEEYGGLMIAREHG